MSKSIEIKNRADASKAGIRKGVVAAFRLHDAECPVGIVTGVHRDYFTVSLVSFLSGFFTDYLDIGYAEVHSIERGTYERADDGTKVYNTAYLGKVQTAWLEEHGS